MKKAFFLFLTLCLTTLVACKNDSKPTNTESKEGSTTQTSKNCKYGVKTDEVQLNWTAYKTTKRVGVKGTFNDIQIKTANNTPDVSTLIRATAFMINAGTVNSKNEDRDVKLVKFFFEKMLGDNKITGSVKSVDGNDTAGNGMISLQMNGVSKETPFTYTVEEKMLTLTSEINTDLWNGQAAIESINKACEEKHKGEDGVSKTWADVSISVTVPLVVTCD